MKFMNSNTFRKYMYISENDENFDVDPFQEDFFLKMCFNFYNIKNNNNYFLII